MQPCLLLILIIRIPFWHVAKTIQRSPRIHFTRPKVQSFCFDDKKFFELQTWRFLIRARRRHSQNPSQQPMEAYPVSVMVWSTSHFLRPRINMMEICPIWCWISGNRGRHIVTSNNSSPQFRNGPHYAKSTWPIYIYISRWEEKRNGNGTGRDGVEIGWWWHVIVVWWGPSSFKNKF